MKLLLPLLLIAAAAQAGTVTVTPANSLPYTVTTSNQLDFDMTFVGFNPPAGPSVIVDVFFTFSQDLWSQGETIHFNGNAFTAGSTTPLSSGNFFNVACLTYPTCSRSIVMDSGSVQVTAITAIAEGPFVPEPGTMAMMGAALIAGSCLLRRRFQSAPHQREAEVAIAWRRNCSLR